MEESKRKEGGVADTIQEMRKEWEKWLGSPEEL